MQIPVNAPGFENREPVLEISGFWSRPRLIIDGLPAPKGSKRGQFILRRNDGVEVVARFVNANFLDPIPHVVIDERPFVVAEPMKWYQWLWVGLPVLLVFIGGALGGLIGGAAAGLNGRVFRSTRQGIVKYVSTGIISAIAVAAFLMSATLFTQAIRTIVVNQPKEFTSTAGGFSIMTPFTLKESTQSADTAIGQIDFHMFLAESGNVAYMVGYSDYPAEIVQQSNPEQMLDGGRDCAAANLKGQVISEDKLTLDTHPGREFTINATANNLAVTVQARMYLVENRLYQIMLVTPKSEFNRTEADSFLKSFKLLQPTGAPAGIIKPTGKPSAIRGPYDPQAAAPKDIAAALAKAKADNKHILLSS
ncbi:MAG: hypothetical protein HY870_08485 [Chloroflexi bacterium]|nr:hypothetical protein [Chloroflexota bacterium]